MTDTPNGQQPAEQPETSPADGAAPNDGHTAGTARDDANTPAAEETSASATPAQSQESTLGQQAAADHTTEVIGHVPAAGQGTTAYPDATPQNQQGQPQQPAQPQPPYGGYQAPSQPEPPRYYPPSTVLPPSTVVPGVQQGQQQGAPNYAGSQQQGAAFGQPQHGQQGPGQGQHNPYASHQQPGQPVHPGQQNPYASASHGGTTPPPSAPTKSKSNRGIAGMVAMLAVGALIGGASGAGATLWVTNATKSNVSETGAGSKAFTINDTGNVNLTTAIAATAGPSVVTLSVQSGKSAGTGSGIVLSDDGYVLTNTHVVTLDGQIADPTIQVTDANGKIYQAKVVGTDPIYDLAVVKLQDASGLTPMEFANSDKLNVGDTAVAIGAPLGLSGTVTDGIVSALNRSITVASSAVPDTGSSDGKSDGNDGQNPFDLWNFDVPGQDKSQTQTQNNGSISIAVIQTDAAINPGNSGGALLDDKGKLIGVNVAIASAGSSSESGAQGGSIGVGFAIPSNIAKRVADEIIKDGKATHGLLGATVKDAASDPSSKVAGALIDKPTANGAAEKAGLQAGDIVTEFNGVPIGSANDLTAQVRALAGGASAKLTFVRGSDTKTVDVTLGTLAL